MDNVNIPGMAEQVNQLPGCGNTAPAGMNRPNCTAAELHGMDCGLPPTLFGEVIPARGLWTLAGSSRRGKSMLLRQLALACVKGQPFLGWQHKAEHNRAIFISTEDDLAATGYLVKRQSPGADNLDNLTFNFNCGDVLKYLHAQLSSNPVDLVIIDAWNDVSGKGLRDAGVMRKTLTSYQAIANEYGCSIGFLYHTGRRAEKLGPGRNDTVYGQGYEAKMRLVMEFRADDADVSLRHLCIVKGGHVADNYKQQSFVLRFDASSFAYVDTGSRVPFEELRPRAKAIDDTVKDTRFDNISDGVHRQLVAQVFGDRRLKFAEAYQALSDAYVTRLREPFGRNKSRDLLHYLVSYKFIIRRGRVGASFYEVNTDDE